MARHLLFVLPLIAACADDTLPLSLTGTDGGLAVPQMDARPDGQDAGVPDRRVEGASAPDVFAADANQTDASLPDGAVPDAGQTDSGMTTACPPLTSNVRLQRVSQNDRGEAGNTARTGPNWQGGDRRISSDGRFVVFTSLASNLVPEDNEGLMDLFAFDRANQTIRRVHVGVPGGYGVAGDGSFVVVQTNPEGRAPVDVWRTADGSRTRMLGPFGYLSRQSVDAPGSWFVADGPTLGNPANGTTEAVQAPSCRGSCRFVSISANGRFLTYVSGGSLRQVVHRYDRDLQEEVRISGPFVDSAWEPRISGGGETIVYRTTPGDVFVWRSGELQQFELGGRGYDPSVDAAGCRMAVSLQDSIRVFDLSRGSSIVVTGAMDGSVANGGSPSISADGRHVAFQSRANNLLPGDNGNGIDVFVATLD